MIVIALTWVECDGGYIESNPLLRQGANVMLIHASSSRSWIGIDRTPTRRHRGLVMQERSCINDHEPRALGHCQSPVHVGRNQMLLNEWIRYHAAWRCVGPIDGIHVFFMSKHILVHNITHNASNPTQHTKKERKITQWSKKTISKFLTDGDMQILWTWLINVETGE